MDHIDQCHQHHHSLIKESAPSLMDYLRSATMHPRQMAATSTYHPELEELEEDYEVEIGTYNPVQPIVHDHGVSLIPISSSQHKIDHHILQVRLIKSKNEIIFHLNILCLASASRNYGCPLGARSTIG